MDVVMQGVMSVVDAGRSRDVRETGPCRTLIPHFRHCRPVIGRPSPTLGRGSTSCDIMLHSRSIRGQSGCEPPSATPRTISVPHVVAAFLASSPNAAAQCGSGAATHDACLLR